MFIFLMFHLAVWIGVTLAHLSQWESPFACGLSKAKWEYRENYLLCHMLKEERFISDIFLNYIVIILCLTGPMTNIYCFMSFPKSVRSLETSFPHVFEIWAQCFYAKFHVAGFFVYGFLCLQSECRFESIIFFTKKTSVEWHMFVFLFEGNLSRLREKDTRVRR